MAPLTTGDRPTSDGSPAPWRTPGRPAYRERGPEPDPDGAPPPGGRGVVTRHPRRYRVPGSTVAEAVMSRAHLARIVLIALLSLLALPAAAFAADPVTLSGTVTRDGTPVAGVEVAVTVDASDLILSATTRRRRLLQPRHRRGASVPRSSCTPRARPPPPARTRTGACATRRRSGSTTLTLETLTPDPVALPLDQVIKSVVCSATGRPDARRRPRIASPGRRRRHRAMGQALPCSGCWGSWPASSLLTRRGRTGPRTRA